MRALGYVRGRSLAEAARLLAEGGGEFVAGGTDLVQRLEDGVLPPARLVDVKPGDGLDAIQIDGDEVRLGALVRLAEVIEHAELRRALPVLVEALEATASPQVRNLATVGGNPLQRTRCLYFRDPTLPCNRRAPNSGCGAREGRNRNTAILGTSEHCIAAHPSDFAVALAALDTEVETSRGRTLSLLDLHRLPGTVPEREHVLDPGELIRSLRLERSTLAERSHYLKVRDRGEFEWALCSAAVAVDLDDGGGIRAARVAVGGFATKPWRLPRVEAALVDRQPGPALFREAAARAVEGAQPRGENAFKLELLPRTIARALEELHEARP